jgi:hypothetical protein
LGGETCIHAPEGVGLEGAANAVGGWVAGSVVTGGNGGLQGGEACGVQADSRSAKNAIKPKRRRDDMGIGFIGRR